MSESYQKGICIHKAPNGPLTLLRHKFRNNIFRGGLSSSFSANISLVLFLCSLRGEEKVGVGVTINNLPVFLFSHTNSTSTPPSPTS